METRGWRLYADDPVSEQVQQMDIQAFHSALTATLREGLSLVLDHNVEAVLEKRREVLREEGRPETVWAFKFPGSLIPSDLLVQRHMLIPSSFFVIRRLTSVFLSTPSPRPQTRDMSGISSHNTLSL